MSILFADDFKGYGGNAGLLLNGLWGRAQCGLGPDPDPTAPPGNVLQMGNFGDWCRRPFYVGGIGTAGCALRAWMNTLPAFPFPIIGMLDGGNGLMCSIYVTATGVIQAWRGVLGHGGTQLGQTAAPVLVANAWKHIEAKFVMGVGTGHIEVRVEGQTVLTLDALDMGGNNAYQLLLADGDYGWSNTSALGINIKDLVMWSGDGAHNNDFLGTVSVVDMSPNADITLGGWTCSTGAQGYPLLNLSPPNDGVDYLSAAYPPPTPMEYELTDLPINVTSVRAIISQVRARKVDGGDGNLQAGLISNGTEVDGSDRPISTAFTYYEDVFETDPHTGASWTPAAADLVQLKINRTI